MIYYVAADGSYGPADGLMLVDTSNWSDSEFGLLDKLPDDARYKLAVLRGDHVDAYGYDDCDHDRVNGTDGAQWCQDCGADIECDEDNRKEDPR